MVGTERKQRAFHSALLTFNRLRMSQTICMILALFWMTVCGLGEGALTIKFSSPDGRFALGSRTGTRTATSGWSI
jgi:hypothetical protein